MSDIEDLVRDGLDRLTEGASAPAGIVARAIRHRRRQRTLTRAGMTSGVAAVAAVAAVLGTSAGGGTSVRTQTTAYVLSRVAQALSAPSLNRMIVEVSTPAQVVKPPHDPSFAWPTDHTWNYRQLYKGEVTGINGKVTEVFGGNFHTETAVLETSKIWTRGLVLMDRVSPPAPSGCKTPGASLYGYYFDLPWWIRATVNCGGLTVAGHVRIDGQQAIKLVPTKRMAGPLDAVIYVSSQSYLLVRVVIMSPPVQGALSDWRWLPATPANLAKLAIRIPAGYRYVPLVKLGLGRLPFVGNQEPIEMLGVVGSVIALHG
jgi:hypothetical protein